MISGFYKMDSSIQSFSNPLLLLMNLGYLAYQVFPLVCHHLELIYWLSACGKVMI